MAGSLQDDDDEVIATINMVPFIDISLVLLIIFLATSTYIVKKAIEADLPRAASGSEVSATTISIVVDSTGAFALNGVEVDRAELIAGIRREVAAGDSVQAIIAGDRSVDYGAVVDVIDLVKLNGVGSFALNIEERSVEESERGGN